MFQFLSLLESSLSLSFWSGFRNILSWTTWSCHFCISKAVKYHQFHVVQSNFFFLFLFFWPCHMAFRILVPQPGIEPGSPAGEAWSPNHWTPREFPVIFISYVSCNDLNSSCHWGLLSLGKWKVWLWQDYFFTFSVGLCGRYMHRNAVWHRPSGWQ